MSDKAARPVYDNYEISPCRRFEEPGKPGHHYFEVCEPQEADVWTLYGHIDGQGAEAIGDFSSRQAAEDVYYRITGQPFTGSYEADDRLRLMHAAPLLLEALEPYAIEAINLMQLANGEDNEDVADHVASKVVHAYTEASSRPPGADAVTRQIERLLEAGYLFDWDDSNKVHPDFAGLNASYIPQGMWAWGGLDRSQQEQMLDKYVLWYGFDHPSSDRVKQNVLGGGPKEEWFAGLDTRLQPKAAAGRQELPDIPARGDDISKLRTLLESLADQADEDCPPEYRSRHFNEALADARSALAEIPPRDVTMPKLEAYKLLYLDGGERRFYDHTDGWTYYLDADGKLMATTIDHLEHHPADAWDKIPLSEEERQTILAALAGPADKPPSAVSALPSAADRIAAQPAVERATHETAETSSERPGAGARQRLPSPADLVERAGPPSPRVTGGQTHKPKLGPPPNEESCQR